MSNDAQIEAPLSGPFRKGFDPRRIGNGRKKGVPQPRVEAAQVTAKAAELAAAALERMREEIAGLDERELAQFAAKPALKLMLQVVNDEACPLPLRLQASRDLLAMGWAKAPTATVAVTTSLDRMSDQELAKLLCVPRYGNDTQPMITYVDGAVEEARTENTAELRVENPWG